MKRGSICSFGFVRKIEEDGKSLWALVGCEGVVVCKADSRSELFFFALEHGIAIQLRN
jgi:hypothetical protein